MARRARPWRCNPGCLTVNPVGTRKCGACGKPRPPKRRPKHHKALELSYAEYVELNDGETCGICRNIPGANPNPGRRKLDRDHEHRDNGLPRGLLHAKCNRAIPSWITADWLRAAADYLDRSAARNLESTNHTEETTQ